MQGEEADDFLIDLLHGEPAWDEDRPLDYSMISCGLDYVGSLETAELARDVIELLGYFDATQQRSPEDVHSTRMALLRWLENETRENLCAVLHESGLLLYDDGNVDREVVEMWLTSTKEGIEFAQSWDFA